ncbi:MAG: flagellar hook-length control protein FliK [Limnohabitans sp.]
MNLSALNPPQANPANSPSAEPSAAGSATERFKSEALSGADFARYFENQVQSLRHAQRPSFAASDHALPPGAKPETRFGKDRPTDEPRASKPAPAQTQRTSQRQASNKTDQADKSNDRTDKEDRVNDSQSNNLIQHAQQTEDSQQQTLQTADEPLTQGATVAQDAPNSAQHAHAVVADANAELSTDHALASQQATLTTIAVSEKLQIITTTNTAASEQSVADFALAMGLDPEQVKTLFGESAATAAAAKLSSNLTSTQQILGMNSLPTVAVNTAANTTAVAVAADGLGLGGLPATPVGPVSTADFQALPSQAPVAATEAQDLLAKMDNLQVQIGTAQAQLTAGTASPVSTLAVLSMMDTQLRAEDIESLKNTFDAVSAFDSVPPVGKDTSATPMSALTHRTAPTTTASPTTPIFVNQPDMAQTYDKLSQKLATELAARMHEKLNAGEWKMKFALKPASLGLVDIQLEMRDGKLSAHFQSDTHLTKDLLQNGSQRLKEALADLGMNNASVFVAQGQAQGQGTQGQSAKSGKFTQDNDNHEKLSEESGLKIAGDKTPRRDERAHFDSYA